MEEKMLIHEHKNRLLDLREEWTATWEEYSREARLAAGNALVDLYEDGTSITELGKLWGTSDRKTIMNLMEYTGRYKPRQRRRMGAPSTQATAAPKLPWSKGRTYSKEVDGNKVTIRVPKVEELEWSEQADQLEPLKGSAEATWIDGLFVEGDQKLQAEKKAGNSVFTV